jgi:hypothetical protein
LILLINRLSQFFFFFFALSKGYLKVPECLLEFLYFSKSSLVRLFLLLMLSGGGGLDQLVRSWNGNGRGVSRFELHYELIQI